MQLAQKDARACFETNLIQSYNFQYAVQQEIPILNCAVSFNSEGSLLLKELESHLSAPKIILKKDLLINTIL